MMTTNIIFGHHETKLLFELEKENLRTFTFHQAKEILSIPDQSIANVLYRMKKKNRIMGIEKGNISSYLPDQALKATGLKMFFWLWIACWMIIT